MSVRRAGERQHLGNIDPPPPGTRYPSPSLVGVQFTWACGCFVDRPLTGPALFIIIFGHFLFTPPSEEFLASRTIGPGCGSCRPTAVRGPPPLLSNCLGEHRDALGEYILSLMEDAREEEQRISRPRVDHAARCFKGLIVKEPSMDLHGLPV